jgi:hypothetical protein
MKKLLAIGDSFTYGDELQDVRNGWAHLLAARLGYAVTNKGVCGSGNVKMVRNLVESNIDHYDLVVIAWSGFDRIEIADDYSTWETWPGARGNNFRVPDKSVKFRNTVIDYINRYHNDLYLYRQQYLVQILLAQSYLKYHRKNYVMLDTFINHISPMRFDPKNQYLVEKIDTNRFLGWPNESMQEWTVGVPIGPRMHFLEQGHEIVAKKLHDFLIQQQHTTQSTL